MFGSFPACMCVLYEYSTCKGHRRASDTPDLESQVVVICHVSAGTQTRSSGRPKPSPQLSLLPFKINFGFSVHCMWERWVTMLKLSMTLITNNWQTKRKQMHFKWVLGGMKTAQRENTRNNEICLRFHHLIKKRIDAGAYWLRTDSRENCIGPN